MLRGLDVPLVLGVPWRLRFAGADARLSERDHRSGERSERQLMLIFCWQTAKVTARSTRYASLRVCSYASYGRGRQHARQRGRQAARIRSRSRNFWRYCRSLDLGHLEPLHEPALTT
jgi:hypothetical protein